MCLLFDALNRMWCQPLICAQSASTTVDPSVCMSFCLSLSHFLFGYLTSTFLFPVLSLNPEKSWMQYSRGIQCLPANSHLAAVSKVQPSLAITTVFSVCCFWTIISVILYKNIFCLWRCLWQQNHHQIVLCLCLLSMSCSIVVFISFHFYYFAVSHHMQKSLKSIYQWNLLRVQLIFTFRHSMMSSYLCNLFPLYREK